MLKFMYNILSYNFIYLDST